MLQQILRELDEDNVGIVAAGIAFFAFLAMFPAVAALVSIYGIAFDPGDVARHLARVEGIIPNGAIVLLTGQLDAIAESSNAALSAGAIFGVLVAVFSAKKGMAALMDGLRITYDAAAIGYVKGQAKAYGLMLAAIVYVALSLSLIVALPIALQRLSLPDLFLWLRWPVLAALVVFGVCLLYRAGARSEARPFARILPGALVAMTLWLVGSWVFSRFVSAFGSYHETYGSLSAVAISMLWLFLSAYAVLLGAEVNDVLVARRTCDGTEPATRFHMNRDEALR